MKAQIWIETVVYTLIGLSIIAVILALVTPKIQETKDKALIDQSVTLLDELSKQIDQIRFTPGNSWPVNIKFDKGKFIVNGEQDTLLFIFEDSKIKYTENGQNIVRGRVNIKTTIINKEIQVELLLNYSRIVNVTFDGTDKTRSFASASLPYDFFMESAGRDENKLMIIDFTGG